MLDHLRRRQGDELLRLGPALAPDELGAQAIVEQRDFVLLRVCSWPRILTSRCVTRCVKPASPFARIVTYVTTAADELFPKYRGRSGSPPRRALGAPASRPSSSLPLGRPR